MATNGKLPFHARSSTASRCPWLRCWYFFFSENSPNFKTGSRELTTSKSHTVIVGATPPIAKRLPTKIIRLKQLDPKH